MKLRLSTVIAMGLGLASALAQQPATGTLGTIERLDPALDSLIPTNAVIEKLAEGFDWSEGPVWRSSDDSLLFSDVPQNTVFAWKPGEVREFLKPSGRETPSVPGQREPGSNGLTFDGQERLVLCQHGDRRIARLEPDGSKTPLVESFEGKRFNSPNDLVYRSNGDLYFTDPPYGLPQLDKDPAKELPFQGVFRLATDGTLTLLTRELSFPNGLAFSPDEKTLYVANSDPQRAIWMAFEVKPDGTLGSGREFYDATPLRKGRRGLPDGMKVDCQGNLFATGPGGVLIFSPDGRHLGTLNTGEATANCAWGDDGATLYITADSYLCRVKTATKGPLPGRRL